MEKTIAYTIMSDNHDKKWFGLKGLNAKESLAQYGIAARYMGYEYECYAPDPDEEDCSIYFVTSEYCIEEHLQNSPQLAKFMFEYSLTLRDFTKLEITEQLHLLCDFFNIIDLLELRIYECYGRDLIELDDTDNESSSQEEVSCEKSIEDSHETQNIKARTKKPILVESFADKTFVSLYKAIQTVVEEFGSEIVLKSEFVNILDDYHAFKCMPGVKRIFHIIVENGIISDLTEDKANISNAFIAKTSKTISLKYGFNEDWVKNSMTAILLVLGYATTEFATKQEPKGVVKYMSESYNSYDSYSKKCRSYKYNENKKDSYLPDRKGVLYSSDKKALVSKGKFAQASYSIRQGTMYIAPESWAFFHKEAGVDLYIPNSVVAIGSCAFQEVRIYNLEIPSSVKYIGWMAFSGSELSMVSMHDGLEYIDGHAFKDTNLTRITLPKSLKYIGCDAFPEGIEILNQSEFLSVRDGLIFNKEETFLMCCTSKDSIILLPETLEEINQETFNFNRNITNIELGKSLRIIGRRAFCGCERLKSIVLPESLEEIRDEAFEYCEELYSIVIPPEVKKIGSNVFACCSSLSEVRCLSPYFEVVDDALYDVKEKKLIAYFGIDREYEVKRGTKIIGNFAFQKISSLKKVTLPKSVTHVGFWAFKDCDEIEEVRILNPDCEFVNCGVDDNIIVKG